MATKKTEELDYTRQPQATNQEEVDAQDTRTKLYQSLGYSYGRQQEESDKSYDQAISQQDRAALARGLGRSSYNLQTQANLQNQKVEARNKIGEAMIADYQSRVAQLDEAEAARKFQTSEREAQQAWQAGENALNRAFQTSEREAQQKYGTSEREAQQAWQSSESALARAFQTGEREAQQAYNTREREAQQAYGTSERVAQQAYNTAERLAQQNWQAGQSALERAQNQAQFDAQLAYQREQLAQNQTQFNIQQAFNERQWAAQQEQWKSEFEYNKMSDSQKIAYNYIVAAAAQGGDVSDALLQQAGISREDYNAMKQQAATYTAGTPKKTTTEEPEASAVSDDLLEKWANLFGDKGTVGTTGNTTTSTTGIAKDSGGSLKPKAKQPAQTITIDTQRKNGIVSNK